MSIENKEEKIKFLENVLKIAKENPAIITDKGRGIFYKDYPAFDESCIIGIHLDEKGRPYFEIDGSYSHILSGIDRYDAESLLNAGDRYFTKYLDEFKEDFHLYETHEGGKDLLDKIR